MKEIRRQERIVRESVKAHRTVAFGAKNALDIVLCEVENNKRKPLENHNPVLKIQRANEESYYQEAVGSNEPVVIDINRMIRNAEKRKDEFK